jgi:hypothetical protein
MLLGKITQTKLNGTPVTIIRKYGYEYLLKEVDRGMFGIENPCFMGYKNMALIGFKKINLGIPKK